MTPGGPFRARPQLRLDTGLLQTALPSLLPAVRSPSHRPARGLSAGRSMAATISSLGDTCHLPRTPNLRDWPPTWLHDGNAQSAESGPEHVHQLKKNTTTTWGRRIQAKSPKCKVLRGLFPQGPLRPSRASTPGSGLSQSRRGSLRAVRAYAGGQDVQERQAGQEGVTWRTHRARTAPSASDRPRLAASREPTNPTAESGPATVPSPIVRKDKGDADGPTLRQGRRVLGGDS